ncbi:hypothetical protein S101258_01760 [Lactiplantibacillus plantarum subsp. plantarum]|uniref:UspA domain-containing protein n=1 Tax=Lactiplantibacillus plantarum subsp. plantarum TaxID=337330 RepID=A0A2S3U5I9_LACPN|nr:hypothetical protein S101258_01760 [Lactiplantibacillus plantarum subsp. plantarum]
MYERILVPLDGSDNAYFALEHAIELANVLIHSCSYSM